MRTGATLGAQTRAGGVSISGQPCLSTCRALSDVGGPALAAMAPRARRSAQRVDAHFGAGSRVCSAGTRYRENALHSKRANCPRRNGKPFLGSRSMYAANVPCVQIRHAGARRIGSPQEYRVHPGWGPEENERTSLGCVELLQAAREFGGPLFAFCKGPRATPLRLT